MILNEIAKKAGWVRAIFAVKGFYSSFFDIVVSTFFINILALGLPIVLMQVYDRIITNVAWDSLTWLIFGCTIALFLESILRLLRAQIGGWLGSRFEHLVNCEIIDRLLTVDSEVIEEHDAGYYLERINTTSVLRALYAGPLFQVIMDLPFSALFLFGIWFLGGNLVLIPLSIIPIYYICILIIKTFFKGAREQQTEINDKRFSFLLQVLGGIYSIKALAFEEQMMRRYEYIHDQTTTAQYKIGFWAKLPTALGSFFTQIALFGVILYGAQFVIQNQMTFGSLAACTMLVGRAMQPILQVAGFLIRFSDGEVAIKKLKDIADLEVQPLRKKRILPLEIRGMVEVDNVSFGFSQKPLLLRNLNVSIHPGQFCIIRDTTHSSVSSLLRILYGSHYPTEGQVLIDGYDIAECAREELRGRVEYLSSELALFNGTILDNISLFTPEYQGAALDAAALTGLNELVSNLPKGFETMVTGKSTHLLPRELVQRIAIAQALVKRPRILLLDKTYQSMDAETFGIFKDVLSNLKGNTTIIVNGEHPELMELADVRFNFADGKIISEQEVLNG